VVSLGKEEQRVKSDFDFLERKIKEQYFKEEV
jgi:hypothetical protein